MISFLKCNDFPGKQYFDEFDECSFFFRREECKHYEITMKRHTEKGKFIKFIITFVCKGCEKEDKLEFKENKHVFEYKCVKCKYCPITFSYENTLVDNEENIQNKKDNIKMDENKNDINQNIMPLMDGKLKEGKEVNNNNEPNNSEDNNNNSKEKVNQKIYKTPNDLLFDNNDNKINSLIKARFSYKGNIIDIDLNALEPIENQYYQIQEKLNFQEIKPLLFNGIEIDMKKGFVENNIKGIIEVSDD